MSFKTNFSQLDRDSFGTRARILVASRFAGRAMEARERVPRSLPLVLPGNNQGTPISEDIAISLRRLVFGQCPASVRSEFFAQGPGLVFRDPGYPLAYGLTITNSSATPMMRAIIMTIQAHVLRAFLFEPSAMKLPKTCQPIMPTNATMQQDALGYAITDIIWKGGNGQSAVLCLPQSNAHVKGSPHFNEDGLTEKLQLCDIQNRDELNLIIRRNIHVFQEDPGPGLMLVLYSAILTRGIQRVTEDMGTPSGGDGILTPMKPLMGNTGNIVFPPISLFLLGRASPFLHNGVVTQENEKGSRIEETGVLIRSPIGLLVWMGTEEKTVSLNVGSRLKTPIVPIWVVIASEQTGVLFGDDKGLLRDYQAENRFQLHYYTSSFHQPNPVMLKINNRTKDDSVEVPSAVLEKLVRTKWGDARLDWCGAEPFM